MLDIVNEVVNGLKTGGVADVYSLFDGKPLRDKGKFITLVGIKSFETAAPVYSQTVAYVPFRAEMEISVAAPLSSSVAELCSYFEENVRGAIDTLPGLSCRPGTVVCRQDKNIGRMLLTASIKADGVRRIEREEW